jgi:transposase
MLTLTDEQLDWLLERIPDPAKNPKGGRPAEEKRKVVQGIFWMLDNGAKWKDLPRRFGAKSPPRRTPLVPEVGRRRPLRGHSARRRPLR